MGKASSWIYRCGRPATFRDRQVCKPDLAVWKRRERGVRHLTVLACLGLSWGEHWKSQVPRWFVALKAEELFTHLSVHSVYKQYWTLSIDHAPCKVWGRELINKAVVIPASLPLGRRVGLGEVITVECNALFDCDKKALGFFLIN